MSEININKSAKVNAKTMRTMIKVSDDFNAKIIDQDGGTITEYHGYVPAFFPEDHDGDYLFLDIDLDTGVITNWTKPSAEVIEMLLDNVRGTTND